MNNCPQNGVDCSQCTLSKSEGTLMLHHFAQCTHFSAEKQSTNFILFILEGEMLINSEEYPGMVLHRDEAVLQAIGSKVELLAITDVVCLMCRFNEVPTLCRTKFYETIKLNDAPTVYTPLKANRKLKGLLDDITHYFVDEVPLCQALVELKFKEIIHVLINYYPQPVIGTFFFPISTYTESFHYFVMKNYTKIRNTEEFAHLGGYTMTTFRRMFKNLYGVPVYVWVLQKRREGILNDLLTTKDRIGVISGRYGFDSLSHFAHFCKDSFGDTPRNVRKRAAAGETIEILPRNRDADQEEEDEEMRDGLS